MATLALCMAVSPRAAAAMAQDVSVDDHSYTNVYLAVSPDLSNQQCQAAVSDFVAVIRETNKLVYNMTGQRVHFGSSLSVVLPSSITNCGSYTASELATPGWAYGAAPLRLGLTHPIFGDNMWTQQPRQCGQPGDFIYLTPASLRDTTAAARRLAGEWAKYRWGVMDEEGHQGDPVYPPAYPISDEGLYSPNACTDAPLIYNETDCSSEQSCSVTLTPALNSLPTSSIVSQPQLPNVVEMCGAVTHNSEAPSKQNVLCSGVSTYQVFTQHQDSTVMPGTGQAPSVSVTAYWEQPLAAAIVLAVENTEAMSFYDYQKNYLLDSLCQAIMNYVQDGVYFGVVLFDSTAFNLEGEQGLIVLDTDTRGSFCQNLLKSASLSASHQNVSVINALEKATELLPPGGSIVLVTRPTSSSTEDLAEAVAAAGLNTVWPVIYATEVVVNTTTWFSSLSQQTGGDGVINIPLNEAGVSLNSIVRSQLSSALYGVISKSQPDQLLQIGKGNCNTGTERSCTMQIDVGSDSASKFLVSVYFMSASSITLPTEDGTCTEIPLDDVGYRTSKTFLCSTLRSRISLDYTNPRAGQNAYAEVVAVHQQATLNPGGNSSGVLLWASSHLRDLQYTNDTAPGLYVQVLLEGQQVLRASVTVNVTTSDSTVTLQLRDDGSGADVTGSDGVYSTFLTGLPSSTTRAGGQELRLTVTASGPGDFMPTGVSQNPPNKCCGSSLQLLGTLDQTPEFNLNSVFSARVTVPPLANLPPGRVTDLTAYTVGANVRLSFTAPGADLDAGGTVSSYVVRISQFNSTVDKTQTVTSGLGSSGSVQTINLHKDVVGCDSVRSYVVTAVDSEQSSGPPSNTARHTISCSSVDGTDALAAGALVGIILGAVFLLVLILILIYLVCNWDNREELTVWQCMTCALCQKDKTKKSKKNKKTTGRMPKQESTFRSPQERAKRVQEIRDVQDLYSKPGMRGNQQRTTTDGSRENRGFDGSPVWERASGMGRQRPLPTVPVNNRSSIASHSSSGFGDYGISANLGESTLQTTLPINNVGIPVPGMMGTISDESFEDDMLKSVNLQDDGLYGTGNFDPYAGNVYSNGGNLDSYGVSMDPYGGNYGGTEGGSDEYPPGYSTYPHSQFLPNAPTLYSHETSGHSSPAFGAPRLNTEV